MQQLTISILASDNWRPFYKPLAKALKDNDPAILLGELANSYDYFSKRKELKDGWFFYPVERMEEETNLSKFKQQKAIKKLVGAELIFVKKAGMPAQRWFSFPDNFAAKLDNFLTSSVQLANNLPTSRQVVRPHESEGLDGKETLNETLKRKHAPQTAALGLEEIKSQILELGLVKDNVPNRMEVWRLFEPYVKTEEFKNQWEFITMGLPEMPAKKVIQTWIVKADFFSVRTLKINKIRSWVETQIRIKGKKNERSRQYPNQQSGKGSNRQNGAPERHSGQSNSWY